MEVARTRIVRAARTPGGIGDRVPRGEVRLMTDLTQCS